jgi:carboxypeptidase T
VNKKDMNKAFLGFFIGIMVVSTALGSVPTVAPKEQSTGWSVDTSDGGTSSYTKILVRINAARDSIQLPFEAEIVGEKPGEWFDIILPRYLLAGLTGAGFEYSVLLWDVEGYSRSVAGSYPTLAEIEGMLHNISITYPNITTLSSIGTTYEGRDIWCLEISDNPGEDEGEPGVFFIGLHHAREWPTAAICLYIAQNLTAGYGNTPEITNVVDNRRLWLVPCMNPDGYYYCHDEGHDWRKNRRYFPKFGTYGVDLNRNYDGSCNGDSWGAWGSIGSGSVSHRSSSEVYCGPWTVSENETQAIRSVLLENDICACITWHTYGEVLLWPWGYKSLQTPDGTYMRYVGQQIAQRMTRDSGSGTYSAGGGGYAVTGDTTDWAYGYAHYVQGRTTFAYTIEACSQFHPPEEKLDQIVTENFKGALYFLQEAENISALIPRVLPPVINEMEWDQDGDYTVSWEEQNPSAEPDYYQLDELSQFSLWTDDAESGTDLWDLEDFSINTSRSHSRNQSFKSRNKSRDVSSMTTAFPIPIKEGMKLSFWCWYKTEENRDYAFVEVSRDGREYNLLDTFTGSSENWTYKEYPLTAYIGDSVFIRFRYTTDDRWTYEGFYVDDISPVARFKTVTTLSDTIGDPFYEVTGKPNGTYFYRVKGHNTAREWGDFSMLQKIRVGNTSLDVEISSPEKNYIYLMNKKFIPFFATVIIGAIDIQVNVSDPAEVDHVELYIDDELVQTWHYLPYLYNWSERTPLRFRHTIKIVAYDSSGNQVTDELVVWKFL